MANPDMPFGFEVIKSDGKENKLGYYEKEASAIYRGDALTMTANGKVQVAAAGEVICGIASESKSASDTSIGVFDDPDQEFMVQYNGVFAQSVVGQNADIVASVADTVLSHSKHEIDAATINVTSTLQFKILALHSRGSNAMGQDAIIRVKPNNHLKSAGVAGI
jgi:hypothetical protein